MGVSIHCPFCKRFTALSIAEYRHGNQVIPFQIAPGSGNCWWMGQCNNCQMFMLVHEAGDIIFPSPVPAPTDERVPEHIRRDLDEAKQCFGVNAYRACAVMARRSMQTACVDKGAKKGNLVDQLYELSSNGTITKDLKEWADVVRWVGNDAAHPNGDEVTREDAEDILHLAEQFLHVIYVTPAIAQEWRAKRGK